MTSTINRLSEQILPFSHYCTDWVEQAFCMEGHVQSPSMWTSLKHLIWGFTGSSSLWPQGTQEPWRAQMSYVEEACFSQARARRKSHPSGQGTQLPWGASHWPCHTDWASVGGQTPWLHGHQCLACSTEAWSEFHPAKAVTCFHLDSEEDHI